MFICRDKVIVNRIQEKHANMYFITEPVVKLVVYICFLFLLVFKLCLEVRGWNISVTAPINLNESISGIVLYTILNNGVIILVKGIFVHTIFFCFTILWSFPSTYSLQTCEQIFSVGYNFCLALFIVIWQINGTFLAIYFLRWTRILSHSNFPEKILVLFPDE